MINIQIITYHLYLSMLFDFLMSTFMSLLLTFSLQTLRRNLLVLVFLSKHLSYQLTLFQHVLKRIALLMLSDQLLLPVYIFLILWKSHEVILLCLYLFFKSSFYFLCHFASDSYFLCFIFILEIRSILVKNITVSSFLLNLLFFHSS